MGVKRWADLYAKRCRPRPALGSRARVYVIGLAVVSLFVAWSAPAAVASERHGTTSQNVATFKRVVRDMRQDMARCIDGTLTIQAMLGDLKLVGSSNVTVTQLNRILGNLHTTELACNPSTDATLARMHAIRAPKELDGSLFALRVATAEIWASTTNMHVLDDLQSLTQAIVSNAATRTAEIGLTLQLGTDISSANTMAKTVRNGVARLAQKLGIPGFKGLKLVLWSRTSQSG